MAQTYTVHKFFEQFPDNDACLEHLMETRYGTSLDCPKCGKHIGINIIQHRLTKEKSGICGSCGKQFDPENAECWEKRDRAGKVVFKRD